MYKYRGILLSVLDLGLETVKELKRWSSIKNWVSQNVEIIRLGCVVNP